MLFHLVSVLHKVLIPNKEAQAECFMSPCHLDTEAFLTLPKKKKKVFTLMSGHFFFESDEYEIEKESTVIKGFGRNISLSNFSYT